MRIRSLQHASPVGKINVTPLIDVVMVLIVFYLIVGKLASDRQARIDLPSTAIGVPDESTSGVIINVLADEAAPATASVVVDGRTVTMEQLALVLKGRVAGEGPALSVQVRADRRLPFGAISPVIQACRDAGLTSVKLVASRAEGQR